MMLCKTIIEVIEKIEVEREQKGSGSRTHQLPPQDSKGFSSRGFARMLFPCPAQGKDATDDRERSQEQQREGPEQWPSHPRDRQEIDEKQQEQEEEANPRDLLAQSPEKGTGGFDFLLCALRVMMIFAGLISRKMIGGCCVCR